MTSGTRDLSCAPNRVSPVVMYLCDDPFDAYVCRMHCPWHEDLSSCTGPLGAFLDLVLAIIPKWNYSQRSFFLRDPASGRTFWSREPFSDLSSFLPCGFTWCSGTRCAHRSHNSGESSKSTYAGTSKIRGHTSYNRQDKTRGHTSEVGVTVKLAF